jgi:hypothetical protein
VREPRVEEQLFVVFVFLVREPRVEEQLFVVPQLGEPWECPAGLHWAELLLIQVRVDWVEPQNCLQEEFGFDA